MNPQLEMVATSGITSPVRMAFLIRSSMGSIPRRSAAIFICDSETKSDCGAPNPRMALAGGLFVYTCLPQ
ncbi:MAG: hypothetical protein BWY79_01672 [Actinobacteria bacterium ADurb.Bin444]|nr:MAG: hypothetical protein BWY79_01672 [Actinobacteria bacterium ADurb.Bin444]